MPNKNIYFEDKLYKAVELALDLENCKTNQPHMSFSRFVQELCYRGLADRKKTHTTINPKQLCE